MGRPTVWTPERDHALLIARQQGERNDEIADGLGVSVAAVNSRISVLRSLGTDLDRRGLNGNSSPQAATDWRAAARQKKTRPCMNCRNEFHSAGPMNRLCPRCRTLDVSPYAP